MATKPNVTYTVRRDEPIEKALRGFKRLCERAGIKKAVRAKRYYEKPSDMRRRELRKSTSAADSIDVLDLTGAGIPDVPLPASLAVGLSIGVLLAVLGTLVPVAKTFGMGPQDALSR